jgi:hypothetical protein
MLAVQFPPRRMTEKRLPRCVAIYHFEAQIVSRGKGRGGGRRSVVAVAAI